MVRSLPAMRFLLAGLFLAAPALPCFAEDPPQSLDEAWWTGPMLANSARPLPQGHLLVESYVYDDISRHLNGYRSLTYLLYGLSDRLTAGLIPTGGLNAEASGARKGAWGLGDTIVQAQYALSLFDPGRPMPDISLAMRETFPTGKYDRLRPDFSDGFGAGVYATSLGLFTQDYFRLPSGLLLRARLDLWETWSDRATARDISVYGTGLGFLGTARPGDTFFADAAVEWSITRNWVLALDAIYSHSDTTHVAGFSPAGPLLAHLPSSDGFGLAPAVEYNWAPNWGVLLGTRIIFAGRNNPASVTPAIAINYVR